jgi:hypothetical protein
LRGQAIPLGESVINTPVKMDLLTNDPSLQVACTRIAPRIERPKLVQMLVSQHPSSIQIPALLFRRLLRSSCIGPSVALGVTSSLAQVSVAVTSESRRKCPNMKIMVICSVCVKPSAYAKPHARDVSVRKKQRRYVKEGSGRW